MTREEFKKHPEYKLMREKIKKWKVGGRYTVHYDQIPKGKRVFMEWFLGDMIFEKEIESIAIGLDLEGNITDETFTRRAK